MSAPAFTPGPWLIHAKHRWVVPAGDAFKEPDAALPMCQLRDPDERLTEDETLANGFLIAAAPELYEAAQLWANYDAVLRKYAGPQPVLFDGDAPEVDAAYDKARDATFAALAKARGEQ